MASSDVRRATLADRFVVIRLLRDFHDAGRFDFSFQPARTDAFVRRILSSPDGVIFLGGDPAVGVLVATRVESPIAPYACAMEHVLWVDPKSRGRMWISLVDAFEAWGRAVGCQRAMLFSQQHLKGAAVGRLFGRRGYRLHETAFCKPL